MATKDTPQRTKAPADYDKLLDRAMLMYDGFNSRNQRMSIELANLLKDVPQREKIMQLLPRLAQNHADLFNAKLDVERYERLARKE